LAHALGRRRSEVHAFSASNSCLRFLYAREIVLHIQVEMVLTERSETPFLIGITSLLLVLERKEAVLVLKESIFPQFLLILGFISKLDSELLRIYDGNVFIVIKSYIFKVKFLFIKYTYHHKF
jgi:hypothetical protein